MQRTPNVDTKVEECQASAGVIRDQEARIGKLEQTNRSLEQELARQQRVVEALRASEERFRLLYERIPLPYQSLDAEGRFLEVNQAWLDTLGYGREEVIGRHFTEFMTAASAGMVAERFPRFKDAGVVSGVEFEMLRKDRTQILVRYEGRIGFDEQGRFKQTHCMFTDITASRRVEQALRESEFFFKESQRAARIGSYQCDFISGIWKSSEVLDQIFGLDESYSRNVEGWLQLIHPDDRAMMAQYLQQEVIAGGRPFKKEYRIIRHTDGEPRWMNGLGDVGFDAAGKVVSLTGTIQDITVHKLAEAERARLSAVVEQLSEGVMITDIKADILYVNPAFEKITGYTRSEAQGRNPHLIKSGKHDAEFYAQMWAAINRGEVWHGHFINRRKDGTLFEEDATISPIRNAAGTVVNFVAVKRDVTRELELERQLLQSQKMEVVGQLAGGVAHDFNNILAAMMMQVSLASLTENLPPQTRAMLEDINLSVERAADLTRQLLLFSRRQVMQPVDLDLNDVVTSLAKMLQRLLSEDVRLHLKLYPSPLNTRADGGMLDLVLMNLAVNARDAMPEGGRLVIETGEKLVDAEFAVCHPGARPGRYVSVSVSDTGSGITPEVLPHIFEPFFTTKAVGKGTGLGLATVFGIVKQHDGWIKAYSEPGQGAHFQIYLPAGDPVHAGQPDGDMKHNSPPPGGTETILLAEDDRSVREMTRIILERHGYRVLEAAHGVAAARIFEAYSDPIHLLLTDIVMPEGLGGKALAARLREHNPALRVVFTSGYSAEIAGQELRLLPGQSFLQKPSAPRELLETVRRCLDS